MINCCEEHVSEAMDTILEEYETYPILNKLGVDNLSTTCELDVRYLTGFYL